VWHPGTERLTLSALLAKERDPVIDAHLAMCPPCRDEAAALGRAVAKAQAGGGGPDPTVPPVRVWRAIAVELGEELGPEGCPAAPNQVDADRRRRSAVRPWRRTVLPAAAGLTVGLLIGFARPPHRPRQLR
jgi:hypothetical protein